MTVNKEHVYVFKACSIAGDIVTFLHTEPLPSNQEYSLECDRASICQKEKRDCIFAKGQKYPFDWDVMVELINNETPETRHEDFNLVSEFIKLLSSRDISEPLLIKEFGHHVGQSFSTMNDVNIWLSQNQTTVSTKQ